MLKVDTGNLRDSASVLSSNLGDIFLTIKNISDSDMFLTGDGYWQSPACDHLYSYVNKLVKTCLDIGDIYSNVTEYLENVCDNYDTFEHSDFNVIS